MKKILFLFFVSVSVMLQAQAPAKFEITPKGFSEYLVADVPNKTKSDLYNKTLEWVQIKFKDSKDAIKSKVENETVKFEGTAKPLVSLNPAARTIYQSRYQVEVSFKDGKYKFALVSLEYFVPASQLDAGGWNKINLQDVTAYYTRTGELRSTYKYFTEIPDYFNKLSDELKQHIVSGVAPAKKSDW